MPIPSTCPSCKAESNAPDHLAGKQVKCPKCKELMRVPLAETEDGFDVVESDAPPARSPARRPRPMDDDESDEPVRKKRRPVEDDEDEEPVRKKRHPVEDDEDEEPVRKKRRKYEEDDEDDDRPRNRRSGKRSHEESTGVSPIRYAIGGIVLVGLLIAVYFIYSSKFGAPNDDDIPQKDPQLQGGPRPGDPQRPIGGKL